MAWCKFDHAGTGLHSTVNGFSISNCIFRNSLCGFHAANSDSAFCSNLLCEDITNEEMGGIYFENTDGIIEKNICLRCKNGVKVKTYSNPEVKNNYITNCNIGIDISYGSSPEVHNNEIYGCEKEIYVHSHSLPDIFKNEIHGDYGIVCFLCYAPNIIKVNYNNLNCNKYAVQLKYADNNNITCDIDATNNYFYTINETEIQELIYDKNDVEGPNQQYYGTVDYIPFLTQEYYNAGIKGD
jgi:parallel beta-helix repeat protein